MPSLFGLQPNQVPRNSDLGPCARMSPEDLIAPYLHVRDEKASGTSGGASSSSTDHTRDLNTVVFSSIQGASLASNQVTLPAGTYQFLVRAPARGGAGSMAQLTLYNVTTSAIVATGENCGPSSSDVVQTCQGRFTITGPRVFEIRQWFSTGRADGLGYPISRPGRAEIYASAEFWKLG